MKEKRDCKIVQDLLPNYIEKLTKEETNAYIEEHLKSCKECEKIFQNMKSKLELSNSIEEKREVNYIKKYNIKIKILISSIIIILLISLGLVTYGYKYFREGYFKAANELYEMVSEKMYPKAFYATIEEIYDTEVYGIIGVKVKGLNINDINHRREFYFDFPIDNIGDNFKIKWKGSNIKLEQLKAGQKVTIYYYGDILEEDLPYLNETRMIEVLDDEL